MKGFFTAAVAALALVLTPVAYGNGHRSVSFGFSGGHYGGGHYGCGVKAFAFTRPYALTTASYATYQPQALLALPQVYSAQAVQQTYSVAPVVQQTYSAPVVQQTYSAPVCVQAAPPPVCSQQVQQSYAAPAQTVQAVAAPVAQAAEVQQTYAAPAQTVQAVATAPVAQTYATTQVSYATAPATYSLFSAAPSYSYEQTVAAPSYSSVYAAAPGYAKTNVFTLARGHDHRFQLFGRGLLPRPFGLFRGNAGVNQTVKTRTVTRVRSR